MKETIEISRREAQRIVLYQNGLTKTTPFGSGKKGILNTIRQLGYVQIDTISVIERAHHHVLFNRTNSYNGNWLHVLQKEDKEIFEYWAHAAAYLPMEDYRYSLLKKEFFKDQKDRWPKADPKLKKYILQQISPEGPLMARDFNNTNKGSGGWWQWKPEKQALERLFLEGDIMIKERQKFQKVFDLPKRIVPNNIDISFPTVDEYVQYLIDRTLQSNGIATVDQISYLRNGFKKKVSTRLAEMVETQLLVKIKIKGRNTETYYGKPISLNKKGIRLLKSIRILSPFDNLTIQRKRLLSLFDFNYQLECYVPKIKRRYGYFCLPILYGYQFIGRLDAKAERKTKTLQLVNLHLDFPHKIQEILFSLLVKSLKEFALFNDCTKVELHHTNVKYFKSLFPLNL